MIARQVRALQPQSLGNVGRRRRRWSRGQGRRRAQMNLICTRPGWRSRAPRPLRRSAQNSMRKPTDANGEMTGQSSGQRSAAGQDQPPGVPLQRVAADVPTRHRSRERAGQRGSGSSGCGPFGFDRAEAVLGQPVLRHLWIVPGWALPGNGFDAVSTLDANVNVSNIVVSVCVEVGGRGGFRRSSPGAGDAGARAAEGGGRGRRGAARSVRDVAWAAPGGQVAAGRAVRGALRGPVLVLRGDRCVPGDDLARLGPGRPGIDAAVGGLVAAARPESWDAAFDVLAAALPADRASVLVIDEVPYLMDARWRLRGDAAAGLGPGAGDRSRCCWSSSAPICR